jgi:hypothetical protein
VSKEHQAQVRPLRVLGMREHGSGRAGVGNTLVPKETTSYSGGVA